jgi:hypothetical protein
MNILVVHGGYYHSRKQSKPQLPFAVLSTPVEGSSLSHHSREISPGAIKTGHKGSKRKEEGGGLSPLSSPLSLLSRHQKEPRKAQGSQGAPTEINFRRAE